MCAKTSSSTPPIINGTSEMPKSQTSQRAVFRRGLLVVIFMPVILSGPWLTVGNA